MYYWFDNTTRALPFYMRTRGIFKACKTPNRKPDYVSKYAGGRKVSSNYWYGKDVKGYYVIRASNHWGDVASCNWEINGKIIPRKFCSGKIYLHELNKNLF